MKMLLTSAKRCAIISSHTQKIKKGGNKHRVRQQFPGGIVIW